MDKINMLENAANSSPIPDAIPDNEHEFNADQQQEKEEKSYKKKLK